MSGTVFIDLGEDWSVVEESRARAGPPPRSPGPAGGAAPRGGAAAGRRLGRHRLAAHAAGHHRRAGQDAATGAWLWELAGDLYAPLSPDADRALTVAGDPGAPIQVGYADLRTGRAIWTRPVAARALILAGQQAAAQPAPGQPGQVVAGDLAVARTDPYPWPCGPYLCLSGVTGEMTALDPETGASRWTSEGWEAPADLGGGRLLAFRGDGPDHAGILDAATGLLLGDLGFWTMVSGPDAHLAFQAVGNGTRTAWIGVLDPVRATVRPVALLNGPRTGGCISRDDVPACVTLDAKVRVWRYRPGA